MLESLCYCPLHVNHDLDSVFWLLNLFLFSLQIWREYHKDKDCVSAVIPVCLIMTYWNFAVNLLLTLFAVLLFSVFVCNIPSIFDPVTVVNGCYCMESRQETSNFLDQAVKNIATCGVYLSTLKNYGYKKPCEQNQPFTDDKKWLLFIVFGLNCYFLFTKLF